MTNLDWACKYVSIGWKIMPIFNIEDGHCSCGQDCDSPGKHPTLKHGVLEAASYQNIVRSWYKKMPQANIAVATGEESGIIVVDVDFKSGGIETYTKWLQEKKIPKTVIAKTGNGLHLYFLYEDGIKNKVGVAPGIDVRSNGGYVLLPPSNHLSGNFYQWINNPFNCQIEAMPEWLSEFVIARGTLASDEDDYTDMVPEGRRNNFIHYLGSFMRAKGFSRASVIAALEIENNLRCSPPLSESELKLVVESVSRYAKGESGLGVWY